MAISRTKKGSILASLRDKLNEAKTVVFVNFHGLPVAEITALRRSLRDKGVNFVVAKKTLIRKVLVDLQSKISGDVPDLPGEVAIASGVDQVAPAKGIYQFRQTPKDLLPILGGIFAGRFITAEEMSAIAAIPGREILYAQLVNLINSPLQRFAVVINEIARSKENK